MECRDGCEFIPWCGLLFDTQTLEVRADYSKYLNVSLRETINLPSSHLAWKYLSNKTRSYLNHKLCALLYDPRVNSRRTIETNMYQALLLCAVKTTCYVRAVETVPGITPCGHWQLFKTRHRKRHKLRTNRCSKTIVGPKFKPGLSAIRKSISSVRFARLSKVLLWFFC